MTKMLIRGGLAEFSGGWEGYRHQIRAFEMWLGEVISFKRGGCVVKMASLEAVSMPMTVSGGIGMGGVGGE